MNELDALRATIAEQLKSADPAKRAGARLMQGTLDTVIEFKRLSEAHAFEEADAIAAGLIDAMALVLAAVVSRLSEDKAIAYATRLSNSFGHVVRARAERKGIDHGESRADENERREEVRSGHVEIRGGKRPRRRTRAHNVRH